MRAALLTVLFAVASLAGAVAPARGSDTPPVTARSIKAAFLYKFAGYVEWPDAADSDRIPLTIGVLGSGEMAEELARITAGRLVNERPVRVKRIADGDSLAGLQILYVGAADAQGLVDSVSPARGLPILVVTDSPGALATGSIINFTFEHDRVRFEVSLPAAEQSRLRLSSRLLAVAQRVQRTTGT